MVDSRDKGARAELKVRDEMRTLTGLKWERVPGSGALHEKHCLKGDLYLPNANNLFCIEVKHYAEDHINSGLFTHKTPQLIEWWEQTIRESAQVNKEPLLIYKYDRSKLFAAFKEMPTANYRYMFVNILGHEFYTCLLEDYIVNERPKFTA